MNRNDTRKTETLLRERGWELVFSRDDGRDTTWSKQTDVGHLVFVLRNFNGRERGEVYDSISMNGYGAYLRVDCGGARTLIARLPIIEEHLRKLHLALNRIEEELERDEEVNG